MSVLLCDPAECDRIVADRQAREIDGHDEVWDGLYVIPPIADNEHQGMIAEFCSILMKVVGWDNLGRVYAGVNVSDRETGWLHNFRCPDLAVFLPGCVARNCDTHWVGGPDFAVEILSAGDRARRKLDFYAQVGVRELLIVDRDPWALELYRLQLQELALIGNSTEQQGDLLASAVLPLTFRIVPGTARPFIEVSPPESSSCWHV